MTDQQAAERPLDALAVSYTTSNGCSREAILGVLDTGLWLVFDITSDATGAKTGLLVERLDGADEGLRQALAIQAEYARDQRAFAAGERDEFTCSDPLPKPAHVPIEQIALCAERALRLAFTQAQGEEELLNQLYALTDTEQPQPRPVSAAA